MVTHLGRLKIVTRRKEGDCRYKYCTKKLMPGQKVMILTKMGTIESRTTIYYKAFHPECFCLWVMWMIEQTPISKDGRRTMELDSDAKEARSKLVRERARILRAIRLERSGDVLTSRVERLGEVDRLIAETGYPVIQYTRRRGEPLIALEKVVKKVKSRWDSERKVPKSVWDAVREMGMEPEFKEAMDNWHKEDVSRSQKSDSEAVKEDSNV